jgi:hypothetical protein
MGTASVYCFIRADDEKDAARRAANEISGYDWPFWHDYTVLKSTIVRFISLSKDRWHTGRETRELRERLLREHAEEKRKSGDRRGEALTLRRISDLLFENMCPIMPWYNLEEMSFSLPDKDNRWWAVMVDFYY